MTLPIPRFRRRPPAADLHTSPTAAQLSRRQSFVWMGAAAAAAAGCGDEAETTLSRGLARPGGSGTDGAFAEWARGGTASLSSAYPDPFATNPLRSACELTCEAITGPCYGTTFVRKDISEGMPGLPMRLSLLILDANCNPIPEAEVDIWHTSHDGYYSGDDNGLGFQNPEGGGPVPSGATNPACNAGNVAVESRRFFRGVQSTGRNGQAHFDTCLPGAYAPNELVSIARAIHIHFKVRVRGVELLTSQLYLSQSLIDEIYEVHPDYASLPGPDTTNAEDFDYTAARELAFERRLDGTLLAYKALVLRGSPDIEVCGPAAFAG